MEENMSMSLRRAAWLCASLLLCVVPAAPSRAEAYLSPFIGGAFGGDVDDGKLTYGGTLMFKGEGGIIGFAVDFGYTPDFFGNTAFADNNVTTLMGNLVLISPGELKIYGSGGVGLLKTSVEDIGGFFDVDENDLGFNVGGGLMILPGQGRLGFQGDVRYFRNLSDDENDNEPDIDLGDLDFWRATAALAIRF
jgi:hypothetical protein